MASVVDILIGVAIFAGSIGVLNLLRRSIEFRIKSLEMQEEEVDLPLWLRATREFFSWFVIIGIGSLLLAFYLDFYKVVETEVDEAIYFLTFFVGFSLILLQIGIWAFGFLDFTVDNRYSDDEGQPTSFGTAIQLIGKVLIVILLGTFWFANIGVDTLFIGLYLILALVFIIIYIFILAAGIASRHLFEDRIARYIITNNSDFTVGDRIIYNGQEGTIEEIGLMNTRLVSKDGSIWLIPNRKLVSEVVVLPSKTVD